MRAVYRRRLPRYAAVIGLVAAVGVLPGSSFADGDTSNGVSTVNTETIQTYLDADGNINDSRIYEQLTLTGDGQVTVDNPVDSDGLRNLDGFGGVEAKDGNLQQQYDVNGVARSRTVSNFDSSKLPISVDVTYELDGKSVSADDLVGATGDVNVSYTVKNLTAKKMPLTYSDGNGGTKTETSDVSIPLVGTVVFDLPDNFTNVQSQAASMGGDGHGGTQMEYLLTLFPPIGGNTVSFGYTAHLTNGTVPPVSFTAAPVDPLSNPTFATAADSYQSGAATGEQLAAGATKINTNLLRLRDGAAQLLAGLIKLNDGAHQLSTGLTGQAAPGAAQLAAGAGQLNTGLAKIDSGAGQLADGTHQANNGGQALADGLTQLHSALTKLPNTLAHNPDYQRLLGALTQIADGVGNRNDPATKKTILGGLNAIQQGLEVGPGNDCLTATINQVEPKNCGAIDAVAALASSVGISRGQTLADQDLQLGKLTIVTEGRLQKRLQDIGNTPGCQNDAQCTSQVNALKSIFVTNNVYDQQLALLQTSLNTIKTKADAQLLNPGAGLDQLRDGLSHGNFKDCVHTQCGIKEAALAVQAGVPVLVSSLQQQVLAGLGAPTPGCDPTQTLRCGAAALTGGLGQLDSGAQQLAGGTSKAADGSSQLAAGANQLSDGLNTASSGSTQLADGTQQAAGGAPQLVDGATQLSEQGVLKIVEAGESTTQQYGKLYAGLAAGAKRAHTDGMMYGAPTGAMGVMAYDFEINGSDGQGSQNAMQLVMALAFAGLGLGVFAIRRRSSRFLPAI